MRLWRMALLAVSVVCLAGLLGQPVQAAPMADSIYIVQPGDTLTRVAQRYGVSVGTLAAANGLRWNSWLYAGQRLTIPGRSTSPPPATSAGVHVVQRGETLTRIAVRYGVSVAELARLNGLTTRSWVYVGQRLRIPGRASAPAPAPNDSAPTTGDRYYVVKRGNTLYSIARWYGTTVQALRAANGLRSNTIYVGQRLRIPGRGSSPAPNPTPSPSPPKPVPSTGASEKWIDIDLSRQRVTAYVGQTPVYSALASTGTWRTPTVVGTFRIYVKYRYTPMSGPGYYLPNVPHTMYFYRGYAIHGAYWHNNFGTPMSHGCVNLSLPDAEWFYNWAPVGTKVVSHY